jgi:hypothetical protein
MRRFLALVALTALAGVGMVVAAAPSGAADVSFQVPANSGPSTVTSAVPFLTGIVLNGQSVVVTCSGTIDFGGGSPGVCDGVSGYPGANLILGSGSNSPPYMTVALIARVGTGPWQLVGSGPTLITGTGEIELAVNDAPAGGFSDNDAATHYNVTVAVPKATVTVTKTVTGDDPGVASYPVKISCTSRPVVTPFGSVTATADSQISLGTNETKSSTVQVPAGGSQTVDVWWPISANGPLVENVTCTATEDLTALPAGATCTPAITSSDTVVLYDLSSEINRSSADFSVTNTCVVAKPAAVQPAAAQPVAAKPIFTG